MYLPIKTPSDMGSLIRSRRKSRGLGQAELAQMVGVSRRWLNQVESGKPGASLSLVLNTLNALNVQIEVRADDEGPTRKSTLPILSPNIDDIIDDYNGTKSDG